jgi:hypothetical protein
MSLDDFKTDGPRTFKDSGTVSGHDQEAIHVHDDLDTSDLDLPVHIVEHTAEYFTYIPPEEHMEGTLLFTCLECNVVGSTYDAVIKGDYLKYRDEEWIDQFKELAMDNKPDKPDMRPESMRNEEDSSDEELSSGLDSFTS